MLREKLAKIKAAEAKKEQILLTAKKQANQILAATNQKIALSKQQAKVNLEEEKKRRWQSVQKELEKEAAELEHQTLWQIEQLNEKVKPKKLVLLQQLMNEFLQGEF